MAIPASLKFDTRVRERLVGDGVLSESEVQKHLESLPDLEGQTVDLTIKQPALSNESDRDIVIVKTSGIRPPVAPIRPTDEDLPIPDDDELDDDEDDDDLDAVKPEAKKPVEKPVEKPKDKEVEEDAGADEKEGKAKEEVVDKEWGDEP